MGTRSSSPQACRSFGRSYPDFPPNFPQRSSEAWSEETWSLPHGGLRADMEGSGKRDIEHPNKGHLILKLAQQSRLASLTTDLPWTLT